MSSHREWDLKCKVYVGNLGSNTARGDLESSFGKYGALKNVWVARNPPGFAFVEYEDPRDAEDAVRAMDGARICGAKVRVEMSSGRSRERQQGGGRGGDRGENRPPRGGPRGGGDFRGGRMFSFDLLLPPPSHPHYINTTITTTHTCWLRV